VVTAGFVIIRMDDARRKKPRESRWYGFLEGAMRILLVLLLVGARSAQAQPMCNTSSEFKGSTEPVELRVLQSLKGTVALGGNTQCSAALVTFAGRSASSPALVLSAGHCSDRGKAEVTVGKKPLKMPDHDEVLYREGTRRPLTLETGKSDEPRICMEADEIVYGTMRGGDILLLRVSETYEQIEKRTGVRPFLVSQETSFAPDLALRIPSAYWQNDRACQVEATIAKVKEERWLWSPVLRIKVADTCGTPHGASGAPAIREDSGEVIGAFGTASDANAGACELNNPCEVGPDGSVKASAKGQGYVHFVHAFYTCLDKDRNVDLEIPGCQLPKPQR
jgi:hypothetical protein